MNEPDRREPDEPGPAAATQQHLPGSPVASTGDAQVDAALTALQGLEELPPGEQADVIESVHDRLRTTLTELDGTAATGTDPTTDRAPDTLGAAVPDGSDADSPDDSD